MLTDIPATWQALGEETHKPYFDRLSKFVAAEREKYKVFPPQDDVYNALKYTPFEQVRVVILGQDPYHDDGQAHGLSFSVRPGVAPPPSLRNIFKELNADLGVPTPNHGYLVPWARQGVLLLNAVLTVRAHQPASHKNKGWEIFTDAALRALNQHEARVVFLLWGNFAIQKQALITAPQHVILTAPHPSPLSVNRGFFGCRHFSKTNQALEQAGQTPINWQLPPLSEI